MCACSFMMKLWHLLFTISHVPNKRDMFYFPRACRIIHHNCHSAIINELLRTTAECGWITENLKNQIVQIPLFRSQTIPVQILSHIPACLGTIYLAILMNKQPRLKHGQICTNVSKVLFGGWALYVTQLLHRLERKARWLRWRSLHLCSAMSIRESWVTVAKGSLPEQPAAQLRNWSNLKICRTSLVMCLPL